MNKLKALFSLFRQGTSVLDPKKWKERQITATVLAGLILAVVHVAAAFGYALPVDMETANSIAAGIIAAVNVVLTITTTDKIGLPSKQVELPQIDPDSILPSEPEATVNHKEAYARFQAIKTGRFDQA
jgi:hypothetical protein